MLYFCWFENSFGYGQIVIPTQYQIPRSSKIPNVLCRKWFAAGHTPPVLPWSRAIRPFLFGYVKLYLQGMAFSLHGELRAAIGRVMSEIPIKILHAVCELWMERLEWSSENNGDYYPWPKHLLIWLSAIALRNWDATLVQNTLYNRCSALSSMTSCENL
jgi:hypothetical protein